MTIADEVRAEHKPCPCGTCSEWCRKCDGDWPCDAIRLADSHDELLEAAKAARGVLAERAGCSRVPHSGAHLLPVIEAAIAKAKGQP